MSCYCGAKKNPYHCCLAFIEGKKVPLSVEELMRARYTAFHLKRFFFLRETTAPEAASEKEFAENEKWAQQVELNSLEIIDAKVKGDQGQVEFKIYFSDNKTVYCHHEISQFRRIGEKWFYRGSKNL